MGWGLSFVGEVVSFELFFKEIIGLIVGGKRVYKKEVIVWVGGLGVGRRWGGAEDVFF